MVPITMVLPLLVWCLFHFGPASDEPHRAPTLSAVEGHEPEAPNNPYKAGVPRGEVEETAPPVVPLVRMRGQSGYTWVQVNVDAVTGANIPGDAANEPSIAIDPTNPDRIVIGWRQFDAIESDFRQAGRAYSTDGGVSWTFPGVLQPGEFASDPVVASDSEGNFYYYSLQPDRDVLHPWGCYMYRSTNGGVTFPGGGVYALGGDKAWMTVDQTAGQGDGNLYLAWSPNGDFQCCGLDVFSRSFDGGLTYSDPVPLPASPFTGSLTVGPSGVVYVCGGADEFGIVPVMRSANARIPGQIPTFNLSQAYLGGTSAFGGPNPAGLLGQIWIAADHSKGPTAGRIYVCGSVRPLDLTGDPLDVMFTSSDDGGVTWRETPVRVNQDSRGNGAYQWFGTMSVAPNGRIDVVWNDTRRSENIGGHISELYYASSGDGGRSWDEEAVTLGFEHGLGYPMQAKLGDYFHMISDDEGANLAFAATFNGEQDVYFMRILRRLDECKLPSSALRGPDCNHNGVSDYCDIFKENSADDDNNGIPDECQSDYDGDGRHDGIDPDVDNDGVHNDRDDCDRTALHAPTRPDNGRSFGDLDGDCSTNLTDYFWFRFCLNQSGPEVTPASRICEPNFDADLDTDTDLRDAAQFQKAFNYGSNG